MDRTGSAEALAEQYRDATNLKARIQLYRFGTRKEPWQRWVFEQIQEPAVARILELGCGPGHLWVENAEHVPPGWTVTLADLSAGMLREARDSLRAARRSFAYVQADAQALPFADGSVDGVVANYMIYHIPDKPRAFSEIRRALRPGGRLYAATNGAPNWPELEDLADRFDPSLRQQVRAIRSDSGLDLLGSATFNLENGRAQLVPYFADVRALRPEPGVIRLTEPEPLVVYLQSMAGWRARLAGDTLARFTRFVADEIGSKGAITLTKGSGMFVATKTP